MTDYLEFGVKLLRRAILVCLAEVPGRTMTTVDLFIWLSPRFRWATRDMLETHAQWLAEQSYVTIEKAAGPGQRLHLTDRGGDIAAQRVNVPGVARSDTEA